MTMTTDQLVQREVIYCVSTLIWEMSKLQEHLDYEDQEILMDLAVAHRDYEEPAQEEGWVEFDEAGYLFTDGLALIYFDSPTEDDAWERLFNNRKLESDQSPQVACEEDGWWRLDDVTFYNRESGETSEAADWEELCRDEDIDPQEWEAFEHWVVSEFLSRDLQERGYTVREFMGLTIWARGTTGQAISMDGVIEDICRSLNNRQY